MKGPFYKVSGNDYNGSTRFTYQSSGTERDPLPYSFSKITCPQGKFWLRNTAMGVASGNFDKYALVRAQAYDSFYKKMGEKAENMINIVEAKKSMSMIANRSIQLLKFAKACKSLRFNDARHALNISQSKKKIDRAKDPAGLWMEYTFGWTPLVNDIGNSVNILQREFPSSRIKTLKSVSFTFESCPAAYGASGVMSTVTHKTGYSGVLQVTNPNLFLANQLGFANPLAVAWDLVPFSFVFDWFLPVNKFVRSFSNDFGMNVLKPATSASYDTFNTGEHYGDTLGISTAIHRTFSRTLNLPSRPALLDRLRLPEISPWLAATSTSLLIQQLAGFSSKTGKSPIPETPRRPASNKKGILYGFNGQYFVS